MSDPLLNRQRSRSRGKWSGYGAPSTYGMNDRYPSRSSWESDNSNGYNRNRSDFVHVNMRQSGTPTFNQSHIQDRNMMVTKSHPMHHSTIASSPASSSYRSLDRSEINVDDLQATNSALRQQVVEQSAQIWKLNQIMLQVIGLVTHKQMKNASKDSEALVEPSAVSDLPHQPLSSKPLDMSMMESLPVFHTPTLAFPNIIKVSNRCQSSEVCFYNISDALRAVMEYGTILIDEGLYEESLHISKPCVLIGCGMDARIRGQRGATITLTGNNVTLRYLSIRNEDEASDVDANYSGSHCISVLGKNHHIEGCDISAKWGHCIYSDPPKNPDTLHKTPEPPTSIATTTSHTPNGATDVTNSAQMNTNEVCDSTENACTSTENACMTTDRTCDKTNSTEKTDQTNSTEKADKTANPSSVVPQCEVSLYSVSMTVSSCQLHHSYKCAIFFTGRCDFNVEDTQIQSCRAAGIEVRDHGNLSLSNCKIMNCFKSGLFAHGNANLKIKNCDVFHCGMAGIEVSTGSKGIIEQSRVFGGSKGGIYIHDLAEFSVIGNSVFGNAMSNIDVRVNGRANVVNNRIYESRSSGIYISQKGFCTATDNVITNNFGNGIELNNGSLQCSNNISINNHRCGLFANGICTGSVTHCDFRYNRDKSVVCHPKGQLPEDMHDNQLDEGKKTKWEE